MNYAIYIFFYFFVPSNPVGMWYNKLIKCTCLACTCILVSLIKYIRGLNIFCFAVQTGSSATPGPGLVPPMLPVAQGKKHIPCQEIIGVVPDSRHQGFPFRVKLKVTSPFLTKAENLK